MTNRRHFLKSSMAASAAVIAAPFTSWAETELPKIRLGIIGVGLRGRDHLELALKRPDVIITAICDIDPEALAASMKLIRAAGAAEPEIYATGPEAFRQLVLQKDLDAVLIATPWEWHTPMAIAAMKAGKYVAVEVPAAVTLEECWQLVHVSEETGMPCMILENVCYRRDIMAVMHMVRQGLFGRLAHVEGGYQHDLREVKFNDGKQPYGGGVEFGEKGFSEAKWRTVHAQYRNGDLYPTHGLGPVANMLNINRGNRFVGLTSMATRSGGLHEYIVAKGGQNHPNAQVAFQLGDIVTTQISTAMGQTILLSHDTNLPRPYSLGFRVQGSKGIWMDVNQSLYLEGISSKPHQWEPAKSYLDQYDHPLWKRYSAESAEAGHGGMDFFVLNAFIEAVKLRKPTPLDVYDAAAWSAVSALSETSISQGGALVEFPDFTQGKWMNRAQDFALDDRY